MPSKSCSMDSLTSRFPHLTISSDWPGRKFLSFNVTDYDGSLRVSLSALNTPEDIDALLAGLAEAAERL